MATKTVKEKTPVKERAVKALVDTDPFESVVEVTAVRKTASQGGDDGGRCTRY